MKVKIIDRRECESHYKYSLTLLVEGKVIFSVLYGWDCDGTIIRSFNEALEALKEFAKKHNIDVSEAEWEYDTSIIYSDP